MSGRERRLELVRAARDRAERDLAAVEQQNIELRGSGGQKPLPPDRKQLAADRRLLLELVLAEERRLAMLVHPSRLEAVREELRG